MDVRKKIEKALAEGVCPTCKSPIGGDSTTVSRKLSVEIVDALRRQLWHDEARPAMVREMLIGLGVDVPVNKITEVLNASGGFSPRVLSTTVWWSPDYTIPHPDAE